MKVMFNLLKLYNVLYLIKASSFIKLYLNIHFTYVAKSSSLIIF